MRYLTLIILFISFECFSGEILLKKGETYIVPENMFWVLKNVEPVKCKVCTADIYISGELSNVEINGVVFHGEFDFSFTKKDHEEIIFHQGTKINLGDSRSELKILAKVK